MTGARLRLLLRCLRLFRKNADTLAIAAEPLEHDIPFGRGEDGVIAADADILPRMELGAALADDDVAGNDVLTAKTLDAQTLALTVAAVLDEPPPFLCAMSAAPYNSSVSC